MRKLFSLLFTLFALQSIGASDSTFNILKNRLFIPLPKATRLIEQTPDFGLPPSKEKEMHFEIPIATDTVLLDIEELFSIPSENFSLDLQKYLRAQTLSLKVNLKETLKSNGILQYYYENSECKFNDSSLFAGVMIQNFDRTLIRFSFRIKGDPSHEASLKSTILDWLNRMKPGTRVLFQPRVFSVKNRNNYVFKLNLTDQHAVYMQHNQDAEITTILVQTVFPFQPSTLLIYSGKSPQHMMEDLRIPSTLLSDSSLMVGKNRLPVKKFNTQSVWITEGYFFEKMPNKMHFLILAYSTEDEDFLTSILKTAQFIQPTAPKK